MKYPHFFIACLLLNGMHLLFLPSVAKADLVSVSYFDRGSGTSGGPVWTGVIDTVSDKLQINTWNELPAHGLEYWTPASLPLVWDAVDSNGNSFDIPQNFWSDDDPHKGTFGIDIKNGAGEYIDNPNSLDFAFVSPLSLQEMSWHPFDTTTGTPNQELIGNYEGSVEFFLGWGGYAYKNAQGEKVFQTRQENNTSVEYDYRMMTLLPANPDPNNPDVTTTTVSGESTNATIMITGYSVENNAVITSVPEPTAVLGLTLISIAYSFKKRRPRL